MIKLVSLCVESHARHENSSSTTAPIQANDPIGELKATKIQIWIKLPSKEARRFYVNVIAT